jgi:hypothetical protein
MNLQPASIYFQSQPRSHSTNEDYVTDNFKKRLSIGSSVLSDNSAEGRLNSLRVIEPPDLNSSKMSQLKLNLPTKEKK